MSCQSCEGQSLRYYFSAAGLLPHIADVNGNDLELYTYDGQGRLIRKSDAFDTQPFAPHTPAAWSDTLYTNDLVGRKLAESLPGPGGGTLVTAFTYD